jgi:hypothetical protein
MSEEIKDRTENDALWKRPFSFFEQELTNATLPDFASRIALEVEEIEACIRMGAPDVLDDFKSYSKYFKQHRLKEHLTRAVEKPVLLNCPKREEWIESCVARFRHYLAPCSVSYEEVKDSGRLFVEVPGSKVVLSSDMIAMQKFWGIGFHSRKKGRDKEIARLYLKTALGKLASDIDSVNRFCAEWNNNSAFLSTVSFSHDRRGNLFEQMILGILNQLEPTVVHTSMYDDVHQWSDLRIIRNGALKDISIQVKFVHRIPDQDVAENHPMARKTIILSPLSVAAFLEESFDPDLFRCSWPELLDLFPVRPKSTGGLGSQIYYLFEHLFESPRTHPLSPIIDVPYPIRLAIHLFVANRAAKLNSRSKWRIAMVLAADIEAATTPQEESKTTIAPPQTIRNATPQGGG